MRDNPDDGKGIERLGRNIVVLCIAGALALVGVIGWGLYVLWRVFV